MIYIRKLKPYKIVLQKDAVKAIIDGHSKAIRLIPLEFDAFEELTKRQSVHELRRVHNSVQKQSEVRLASLDEFMFETSYIRN